jgi:hypothetical protein
MSVKKLLALDPEDISAIIRAADNISSDFGHSDVDWSDTPTLYLVQVEAMSVFIEERRAARWAKRQAKRQAKHERRK